MREIFETTGLATLMFAATNADDLVLLTLFFARAENSPRQILLGQLLGIGALVAASLLAAALALAVPHGFLPWLGLVPILIGLSWLRRPAHADKAEAPVATRWWTIAAITIANGGDNLGVYIPQFALLPLSHQLLTAGVFLALTLVWCWLARLAVRQPSVGPLISRTCRRAAPWVLIGLGIWIVAQHPVFGQAVSEAAVR